MLMADFFCVVELGKVCKDYQVINIYFKMFNFNCDIKELTIGRVGFLKHSLGLIN